MKTTILIVAIALGLAVSAKAETYDFDGFDKITVENGVELIVSIGGEHAVSAEARRGDIDRLVMEQAGDRLTITRESGWGFWDRSNKDRFVVTVVMPGLVELEARAGASADVAGQGIGGLVVLSTSGASVRIDEGLAGPLRAEATGGGSLRIEDGRFEAVTLRAAGGGSLRVSGQCDALEVESRGGGSVRAGDLLCQSADLSAQGGASIRAYASETADVSATGGASVRLGGGATVAMSHVTSGASLRQTGG